MGSQLVMNATLLLFFQPQWRILKIDYILLMLHVMYLRNPYTPIYSNIKTKDYLVDIQFQIVTICVCMRMSVLDLGNYF